MAIVTRRTAAGLKVAINGGYTSKNTAFSLLVTAVSSVISCWINTSSNPSCTRVSTPPPPLRSVGTIRKTAPYEIKPPWNTKKSKPTKKKSIVMVFVYKSKWATFVLAKVAQTALGYTKSEEHTSELQTLMIISYTVFFFKNKTR